MKRILLSLFVFSFSLVIFAANVEIQDARTIALNAYFQKLNTYHQNVSFSDLKISDHFVISQDGETMLYAFNFSNFGFIIISADDAMTPVIGYSFESNYNPLNSADNFKGWINGRVGAIKFIRENNLLATPEIKSYWDNFSDISNLSLKGGGKSVEPLLTCTWNQDWPYNYYCPMDAAGPGGRVYVGCVATAMSQIMLYWRYPRQGSGSHSYNQYPYGTQSANFGETIYDWDGMVDNSDSKINLPMALIGYHTAVSVDMDFSPDGSGAYSSDVPFALRTYFGYSNQVQYIQRNNTPFATWKNYIIEELDLIRPVYYSGTDAQSGGSGHAFVLDGYHTDGTFHFNFGWSGQDNGWYDITSPAGYEWYYNQGLVRKIFPADASYPFGCDPDIEVTNPLGSIEDGSGPQENYEQGVNCSWLINPQTLQDSITKIKLNFVVLDTESDDYVTIYDGETTSSPVLGTYSGQTAPTTDIYSTGNKMLIVLEGDGDATTGPGFRVEYNTIVPSWCSGLTTLSATSGTFDDGSGSWYYKNQSNCMWKIQPEWASDLTLTFTEFDTEENVDVVKIYDASNNQLLATYSGQYTTGNMPDPITIPSGKLFMTFQSDGVFNFPGWTAEWEIGNTSVEDKVAGLDQLMVYPNPAENLLNISFNIEENQSLEVRLISAMGNVIYSENMKDFSGYYVNTIDISSFAKGVYFLSISNDKGTVNNKVVIK
jgi:hypothetical protein